MADDNNQRPFRSNDPYSRDAAPPGADPSGHDPLAELARLIGQTDPFSEFGHDNVRRTPAVAAAQPAYQMAQEQPPYSASRQPPRDQQSFAGFDRSAAAASTGARESDRYRSYGEPDQADLQDAGRREADSYYQGQMQEQPVGDDDYYAEGPPSRRRLGIIAIASVCALGVIGTAGAFGYRALFASTGSRMPPPVIKAEAAPSKIVPSPSSTQKPGGKVIYDRVGDRGQDEKLVSREEMPVGIKDKPTGVILPAQSAGANGVAAGTLQASAGAPNFTEPKKIHTIVIRPDQPDMGLPPPTPTAPVTPSPAASMPTQAPAGAAPSGSRVASAQPLQAVPEPPQPRHVAAPHRAASAVRHAQAAPNNAPLSLSPDANRGSPQPRQPVRVASAPAEAAAPAAAASSGGHGAYVQVASRRSEADAQASFRVLQGKYPKQLSGRQSVVRRADLGAKGVYYRTLVGPFASAGAAAELCSSLKAAGGSCLIQRN